MRHSGVILVIAGVLLLTFFALTDPRLSPGWAQEIGWSSNMVDAVADSVIGTAAGIGVAVVLLAIGVWLVIRRAM